jgi:hypothetical protein
LRCFDNQLPSLNLSNNVALNHIVQ